MPASPALPNGYYSIRAAARELGLSEKTLRERIERGIARTTEISVTVTVIDATELQRLRNQGRRPGGSGWNRGAGEPSPDEDFAAWLAWNKRTGAYPLLEGERIDIG